MNRLFKKLFGKKRSAALDIETAPLSAEQLEAVAQSLVTYSPPQLLVGCAQSVGMLRDHNEDTIFALNSVVAGAKSDLPFGIFIVADGMGGHLHGEIASGIATRVMAEVLLKKIYFPLLNTKPLEQLNSIQEIMEKGVSEAQSAVHAQVPGGGTTLTVAVLIGEQLITAHVGDSRAYLIFPDGRLQVITQDHSLVNRLVELGQLTKEEAATHPQRNVLYRAIGQSEPFYPDINHLTFPNPGYLMLCSDGLWGVISEAEILHIITTSSHPSLACHALVNAANTAGGPDNISVILLQYLR
ncbi:MAG: serine/threonine-protein phosphatase [Chloroflexi bacterium]|nr:serine/threonine-protein phosphatase [Chloroflexota bacterium]